MSQTKLIFPATLPDKHKLLAGMQSHFPEAKAKLSFNNYIDIDYNGLTSSLDLTNKKIDIDSKVDDLSPIYLLSIVVTYAIFSYFIYLLTEYFQLEEGNWPYVVALFVFYMLYTFLFPKKTEKDVEEFHIKVVNYLKDAYQGQEK